MLRTKIHTMLMASGLAATFACPAMAQEQEAAKPTVAAKSIYDFTIRSIDGKKVSLAKYKGDVMLIVNVASK